MRPVTRRPLAAGLALLLAGLAAPAAGETAVLRAARPGQPALVLRAATAGEDWVIRVRDGGRETQRIAVRTDLPDLAPRLADADGDGAPDLWIPVIGGNADTAWDLWLMRPRQARFVRAGEIGGLAFARDADGRLLALGRNGCCRSSLLFHGFAPDGRLRELFSVEREEGPQGARACEGVAIAGPPPPALLRDVCAPGPGHLPGARLPVP